MVCVWLATAAALARSCSIHCRLIPRGGSAAVGVRLKDKVKSVISNQYLVVFKLTSFLRRCPRQDWSEEPVGVATTAVESDGVPTALSGGALSAGSGGALTSEGGAGRGRRQLTRA